MAAHDDALKALLLDLIPADGSTMGNITLKAQFTQAAASASLPTEASDFERLRDALLADGTLVKGRGRGGAVRRAEPLDEAIGEEDFSLQAQQADTVTGTPTNALPRKTTRGKTQKKASGEAEVLSYRHTDKRRNNPEVGMVNAQTDPDESTQRWCYDPHIDPSLQFDFGRAAVEKLIDDALASGDADAMRATLEELKRYSAPYLNWTGKAERGSFAVDTVSLHVHERIDPASILAAVRRQLRDDRGGAGHHQPDLFAAPFENLPLRDAIDFYRHEKGWSNRLVAGDSLQVMNSLLQKEGMAGQVQMIYIDPPYGIKYGSNFQPFVNKRDVKDRKDEDLTQEPEMIKAFRDTWELGIHSYLTYLRDRLLLARELLSESGSVFVQISDENLHHVREVMDEVFGPDNFLSIIVYGKTTSATAENLASVSDYLVWYCRNTKVAKYHQLYFEKEQGQSGATKYNSLLLRTGEMRPVLPDEKLNPQSIPTDAKIWTSSGMTSQRPPGEFPVDFKSKKFLPSGGYWKTGELGFSRLIAAGRIHESGRNLRYVRFLDDFPAVSYTNLWQEIGGIQSRADPKVYVVQTSTEAIQRCLLMTTDPGDLVLDPTCGSGTTAYVAEKWGRRWITCDTSRVAVTLAKQRLMTASFDYYALRYPHEGLKGAFIYKTVPHVTLKSIANNPEIDEIWGRMHPVVESALSELNTALGAACAAIGGGQGDAPIAAQAAPTTTMAEWAVPFDFPEGWPDTARTPFEAFHAARQAMQRHMDDSIAAHADQETLYDQPEIDKTKRRITGPFSVEAVPFASVLALDETRAPTAADTAIARSGESARQHEWRDELLKTGIRGKAGQRLDFAELETLPGTRHLHASGTLAASGDRNENIRVVVSFGPPHAALEQRQVEHALREAGELFPLPKMIVFCAFAFDPEAAKDIDQLKGITALKAQMNTDLLTEDLKKGRASNQSFWLMGQPDVELRRVATPKGEAGDWYQVEVNGFDYFDTRSGELVSGGKRKIAAWSLDTDYDERSLFPRQVFFPMAGAKDGWHKLRKTVRAELDEALLEQFHGTVSLPFPAGDNRKAAVKIVDDRGIESLKIMSLD